MCGGIFDQAAWYRIRSGRGNLWSDGLALDLIWIITGWNEDSIYIDTDSIKLLKEDKHDN